jgi:Undecaprenyl-phosphate galactose phosphotransferase WbaP
MSASISTATHFPALRIPAIGCRRWATLLSFVTADSLALCLGGAATVLERYLWGSHFVIREYLALMPGVFVFFIVFTVIGLYPGVGVNPVSEFRRIVVGACLSYMSLVAVTLLAQKSSPSSCIVVLMGAPLTICLILTLRAVVRRWCSRKEWWGLPTVILGAGKSGLEVLNLLRSQPHLGFRPVAVLDRTAPSLDLRQGLPFNIVVGDLSLAPLLAKMHRSCYAMAAMPELSNHQLRDVISDYASGFSHVLLIPDYLGLSSLWVSTRNVGGIVGVEVSQILVHRFPQFVKRAFDLVFGFIGLIALLPLLAILYTAVRLTTSAPVMYGQSRIGLKGSEFTVWKFRSMVPNAAAVLEAHMQKDPALREEWERDQKLKKDPRVTPVGRVMRKTSLDELPQTWNVLCGHMSLVGPRPIVKSEIAKYGRRFALYEKVRPGITGMWQISGRNNTTYEERTQFDEYYVRNWSVWLDLYILVKTLKTVLFTDGAY